MRAHGMHAGLGHKVWCLTHGIDLEPTDSAVSPCVSPGSSAVKPDWGTKSKALLCQCSELCSFHRASGAPKFWCLWSHKFEVGNQILLLSDWDTYSVARNLHVNVSGKLSLWVFCVTVGFFPVFWIMQLQGWVEKIPGLLLERHLSPMWAPCQGQLEEMGELGYLGMEWVKCVVLEEDHWADLISSVSEDSSLLGSLLHSSICFFSPLSATDKCRVIINLAGWLRLGGREGSFPGWVMKHCWLSLKWIVWNRK